LTGVALSAIAADAIVKAFREHQKAKVSMHALIVNGMSIVKIKISTIKLHFGEEENHRPLLLHELESYK